MIDSVRIDTTHFVCTEPRGDAWEKAVEMNIPVVRPEYLEGCEREGKIVPARAYYLDADPKLRQVGANPNIQHQSRESLSQAARSPPVRTSSIPQTSQTSLPNRPQSPEKETGGEPGPSVAATPTLSQGEVNEKDLPPDPPHEEDEDTDEEPRISEKQLPPVESEDESEDEKESPESEKAAPPGQPKSATVEDEKGGDMEDVAL